MVRVVTDRMQETAPLIAVAFILPAGGCFDVYMDPVYYCVVSLDTVVSLAASYSDNVSPESNKWIKKTHNRMSARIIPMFFSSIFLN